MATPAGSIHVGPIQNAFGAIAIGSQARAFNFNFALMQRVVIGKDRGVLEFDPRVEDSRPPLTPPHPHSTEPELGSLIGRHAELQALLSLFQQTCTGTHGATVFLTGEPGMGRHALARRLVQLAEEAEPAPDLHRRTFTLLTLTGRFWVDPDAGQQAAEPRTQDIWGEWSDYIRRSFPRASAAAGPTWVSLMSQLAATNEGRGLPPGLRDEPASLLAFLRVCLEGCDAGLLSLEHLEDAPDVWWPLLESLAREVARDLKLELVLVLRAPRPIQDLEERGSSSAQRLALQLCRLGIASAFWLGPIDVVEFETCFSDTEPAVRQALYRLAGGAPLWIEALWEDWKHHNQVKQDRDHRWRASSDFVGGSTRHYAEHLIRRGVERPGSDFMFSFDEVMQVLCTAALEGPTFTADAVAEATNFDTQDLVDYLAAEWCGPGGLLVPAPGIRIEQPETRLRRDLHRFRFEPLGAYYALLQYPTDEERRTWAYRLCDALERAYWPYSDRLHLGLARLFELGGAVDPDGAASAEAQQKRNQRMAHYGLNLEVTEKLEREVEFWRGAGDEPVTRYQLLSALGRLAHRLQVTGPLGRARDIAVKLLEVAEGLQASIWVAAWLLTLGQIDRAQAQYGPAREQLERAVALYEQLGDLNGQAACLLTLGQVNQAQGQYGPAREQVGRALALCKQLSNLNGQAACLLTLGQVNQAQGQHGPAREQIGRALALYEQLGDLDGQAACLATLGQIDQAQGQYGPAREQLGRALALKQQLGDLNGQAACLQTLGQIDRAQGQYGPAREQIGRALRLCEQLGDLNGQAACLGTLGQIDRDQGQYGLAREQIGRALALNEQLCDLAGQVACLQTLGQIDKVQGQYGPAREQIGRALALTEQLGNLDGQADCLLTLGQVDIAEGDRARAYETLTRALAFFEQIGAPHRVQEVREVLRQIPDCSA